MPSEEGLRTLLARTAETAELDFKSKFEVADAGDWIEIIKDIAAFANSGGGTILIGVNDDGAPSGADVTGALAIDPADLTNRIHKYTSTHFHGFKFIECEKGGHEICAIMIRSCRIPLVFTRVGTYEVAHGRQKTVFSVGTVYFRHGAKSEPGTSEDLRMFLERELELIKRSWLDGIAKVVEAPAGSRFAILPPETEPAGPSGALPLRLTDDPTAPAYYAVPLDTTHPIRQKEVMREVNAKLAGRKTINAHDIFCVRRVYSVEKDIKFCYTQNYATPRYSEAFVDWVVQKYEEDASFFSKTKQQFDQLKRGAV
jgi:Putative DNA-binding domain/EC042_2821-lke REase